MDTGSLFGNYLLLERIAVGGMAEVFIAKSLGAEAHGQLLALKLLLPEMAEDTQFIEMFADEAHTAVMLNHPGIVETYELGEVAGRYYIAMEYIPGCDLKQLLRDRAQAKERIPLSMMAYICVKICEALDYAHQKTGPDGEPLEIVHRDISPQNILLGYNGAVKIADFGIAKARHRSTKTEAGTLKGKLAYLSPEQLDRKPATQRSDLFSLGVLMYEMATGVQPFAGDTDLDTISRIKECRMEPPSKLAPDIAPGLAHIITCLLSKEPAARPARAGLLIDAMADYLQTPYGAYNHDHLAAYLVDRFADRIETRRERMRHYAAAQPPVSNASEAKPPEAQARAEVLQNLLGSVTGGEAPSYGHTAKMLFYPVRIYVSDGNFVDGTTTQVSDTQLDIATTTLVEPHAAVELWLQPPGLLEGLSAHGRVTRVQPMGGQSCVTVELLFGSGEERANFCRALRL